MPQRLALASRIATATCACPRRWANPAPDRWFEPLPPPPLTGLQVNFGLPRLCRPPSSPQDCGRELSLCFRERKRKRRQSRTGHGRTRHKGRPPGPPAYPPLSPQIPLAGRLCDVAEAIYDHRGRIAPPTPKRSFSGSLPVCQEGGRKKHAPPFATGSWSAKSTRRFASIRPTGPSMPHKKQEIQTGPAGHEKSGQDALETGIVAIADRLRCPSARSRRYPRLMRDTCELHSGINDAAFKVGAATRVS